MNPITPYFQYQIPPGDDKSRRVCSHCNYIDYENPKIVSGAVCLYRGSILLCQRAIQPRRDYWTIPAGFMELGESVDQAAVREAREEACVDITVHGLVGVYSVPELGQVHMMFSAECQNQPRVGSETKAVRLVEWADIVWEELAFPTVAAALRDWHAGKSQPPGAPAMRNFGPVLDSENPD